MRSRFLFVALAFAAAPLLGQGQIQLSLAHSRVAQFDPLFVTATLSTAGAVEVRMLLDWDRLEVVREGEGGAEQVELDTDSGGGRLLRLAAKQPRLSEHLVPSSGLTERTGRYRMRLSACLGDGAGATVHSPWVAFEVVASPRPAAALQAGQADRATYDALLKCGVSADGRIVPGCGDQELALLQDRVGAGSTWDLAALGRCELALRELKTCYDANRREQLEQRIAGLVAAIDTSRADNGSGGLAAHALYLRARLGWSGIPCAGLAGDAAFAELRRLFPDSLRAYDRLDGRRFGNIHKEQ